MIRHPPRSTLFPYTTLSRPAAAQHVDGVVTARRQDLLHRIVTVIGDKDVPAAVHRHANGLTEAAAQHGDVADRKSTRLNSSHSQISYAVFCLKKKKKMNQDTARPQFVAYKGGPRACKSPSQSVHFTLERTAAPLRAAGQTAAARQTVEMMMVE